MRRGPELAILEHLLCALGKERETATGMVFWPLTSFARTASMHKLFWQSCQLQFFPVVLSLCSTPRPKRGLHKWIKMPWRLFPSGVHLESINITTG